jgi:hypothetical protein
MAFNLRKSSNDHTAFIGGGVIIQGFWNRSAFRYAIFIIEKIQAKFAAMLLLA